MTKGIWQNKSLGSLASITMGQSPPSSHYNEEGHGLPFLQGCAEFGKKNPSPRVFCTKGAKHAQAGDILLSVRAPVGRINVADQEYIIGRGIAAVRARQADEDFLYYLLLAKEAEFRASSQGSTFEAVNSTELGSAECPVPIDEDEQREIAAVLRDVDRAISAVESSVGKQGRVKFGLMQDLLTRGIDEKGNIRSRETHEFQESPLGWVPKAWQVERISSLASKVTSGSRGWARYYAEEGAIFIRIGNLTREHINFRLDDLIYVDPPVGAEGSRTEVRAGDILISITADLGIVGVIPEGFGEAYINQHISLIRLASDEVNPRWAGHFMQGHAFQEQVDQANESGAKAGLNLPTVSRFWLAYPRDADEQEAIVKRLDSLDQSIVQNKVLLSKLERLKAGLMRDLLTGKVRTPGLREEAPQHAEAAA